MNKCPKCEALVSNVNLEDMSIHLNYQPDLGCQYSQDIRRKLTTSIKNIFIFFVAIGLFAGCATTGPRANFYPVSEYKSAKSVSSQGIIKISKINMTGNLKDRDFTKLLPPFVAGFSKDNSTVSLVDGNKDVTYFDGELILNILTKSSLYFACNLYER